MTGTRSEVVPGGSMDPTHAATAIVAPPVWDLEVVASGALQVVASVVTAEPLEVVASVVAGDALEVAAADALEVAAADEVVAGKRWES